MIRLLRETLFVRVYNFKVDLKNKLKKRACLNLRLESTLFLINKLTLSEFNLTKR